ncbi:MAG: hypothetical protein P4L31_03015 [Candidatus Babeliales bacterium]|nr:hypothetical protein [Candidatus Babeliales bacterium]
MKFKMRRLLSIIFCIGCISSVLQGSDLDLTLDDPTTDTASLTAISSAPAPDIAPDLNLQTSATADVTSAPATSLDDLSLDNDLSLPDAVAQTPATASQQNSGLPIDLPVIGTIYLYPVTENGKTGMSTDFPFKNKQLTIGPLTITQSKFQKIGNKLSYKAAITLFGSTGFISISKDTPPKPDTAPAKSASAVKVKTKKPEVTYSIFSFDLDFNKPPTLDLMINDQKAELTDLKLVLDKNNKTTPTKITAQTKIFGQNVDVTIGIGKKTTSMWAEVPSQSLVSMIPQVAGSPFENSIVSNLKVTLKNISSKDNQPLRFILDGQIEPPTINGLDPASTATKQLIIRVAWDKCNGGFFTTSSNDFSIPYVGTIKNASFTANFPIKGVAPTICTAQKAPTASTPAAKAAAAKSVGKASSKEKKAPPVNSFVLSGDIEVNIPDIGTFDTQINALINKKGFVFAVNIEQQVTVGDAIANAVTMSYSSVQKKLALTGKCDIDGHQATLKISQETDTKGKTTFNISADLIDKTALTPFSSTGIAGIKDLQITNPSFIFTKKGTVYEATLQGNVTYLGLNLTGLLHEKKDKKTTILLEIKLPEQELSKGIPGLNVAPFSDLNFTQLTFVISSAQYEDKDKNVTYKPGANVIANATLGGSLAPAAAFTKTTGIVQVSGYLAPTILESVLDVTMSNGFKINDQASFGSFSLEISGKPTPSFALKAVLFVTPSKHDDTLKGSADIAFKPGMTAIAGTMEGTWHNPLGIRGIDIANMAVEISIVPGPEPIESFGLAGSMALGKKCVSMSVKIGPDAILAGSLNEFTLNDYVQMAIGMMQAANIPNANTLSNVASKLPLDKISLKDLKVYMVPTAAMIGEISFDEGLTLRGDISIPGFEAYGNINSSKSGIMLDAYCTEVNLDGVLLISKSDAETVADQKMRKSALACVKNVTDSNLPSRCATPINANDQASCDAARYEKFKNGPLMHLALTPDKQEMLISGKLKLADIFQEQSYVSINSQGMSFDFLAKALGNSPLLEAHVNGTSSIVGNAPQFELLVEFTNKLNDYIIQQVHQGIQTAKDKITEGINQAKATSNKKIQDAQDTVNSLQKRICELQGCDGNQGSIARHRKGCL